MLQGEAADAAEPDGTKGPEGPSTWGRRIQVWRSPAGQPAWTRPALLVVAALAAFAYSWHVGSTVELYYAAAVRSMAHSWHDFVFGGFDPAGTITVDKLPGALWVQALSVRLFGVHLWALLLPQAVEGALTVLVLFHAVRRLAGPLAGMVAAVVLAASPATMTLDRGNIPDSLMILLVVLAADATVSALLTGRWRSAVLAGVWVALAFQAKMLEAWLVLPALGLAYLVAGRGSTMARLGRIAALGATAAVVSLSYMTFVTLTPAAQRPYEDGSTTNSVFHQVFVYNGFSRVGQASPNETLGRTLGAPLFFQSEPPPAANRLLTADYGHDTGWLIPAAVLVAGGILVARWRRPRTDLPRAGAVLWGTWLVVLAVVFTFSTTMNSYYAAALSPAVAALLGIGGALAWEYRRRPSVQALTAGVALVTVGYAAWLLPPAGTGLPPWLAPVAAALGLAAAAVLGWSLARGAAVGRCRHQPARRLRRRHGRLRVGRPRRAPGTGGSQRVSGGHGARPIRHSVPAREGDRLPPFRLRAAAVAPGPGRPGTGPPRGARVDGGPDLGGGRPVHLRHGRRSPPAGRLHRHHSLAVGCPARGADFGRVLPPGSDRQAGCHSGDGLRRRPLPPRPAEKREWNLRVLRPDAQDLLLHGVSHRPGRAGSGRVICTGDYEKAWTTAR